MSVTPKLYGYWRSSCSYRVRIALGLKGIAYESIPVHLLNDGGQQRAEAFRARNPMEQVPLLEIEHEPGLVVELTQSVAILEYLEERFPAPALLPTCSYLRARVRKCVEIVNSGVQPLQNLSLMGEIKRLGGDAQALAKAANERGLRALEAEAESAGGAFMIGDAPTLADVLLVPQIYSARRFGVDMTAFPTLSSIDARLAQLPGVAAAHPDLQPDAEPAPARS
ncbi:MAG: maleylacetoacetate isomerase [Polyangiaceae bacterium]|nr:maleylacetoacetate isomerase [Polyangiaceae bacterium]MBK8942984.1 maleylacetoacetate isomerase [Polyangiaceae bacterium]